MDCFIELARDVVLVSISALSEALIASICWCRFSFVTYSELVDGSLGLFKLDESVCA